MPSKSTEFFQLAYSRVQYEHELLSEQWRQLDSKAQSTATIAGVFMAAAFAFLQSSAVQLTESQKFLFFLVVACLVLSIGLSVWSMFIEDVPLPPSSSNVAAMVADVLLQAEDELDKRYDGMLADTIDLWIPVNLSLLQKIEGKGSKVQGSQVALMISACLLAILTLLVLFCPNKLIQKS